MAIQTFNAKAEWKGGALVEATSRSFKVTMDEPVELGGTNTAMNPVELLLCSLGGCMSIVAGMFAPKFRVELKGFSVELEGDLDPDGFTGKNPDVRKGFSDIRYKMHIISDSPEENIKKLCKFIEEHCPVKDTLEGVSVTGTYVIEK
ncbi:OsmC family protein [Tepidanaerobacter sp. GT38]|uniref:OsmC family protein n=1 Tax=Tepidanaerobacter sp. GT38 TaxID=2722793 RepID=UPI001F4425BD|nr:OsmC family protein [Tepidanaerobacter sp. GT38]MCG1011865.1 OsmC family protein [Tepidanaerobacter sp. GT38]